MTLCSIFRQISLDTWYLIKKSRIADYQLKEETITDYNMLSLKLSHSKHVKTRVFTKHVEGKNGADWEWWFKGNSNKWIGFRVQAKILNIRTNEFEHLHYKNHTTGLYQCDKLINNAFQDNIFRFPLYCLFIQTGDKNLLTRKVCKTFKLQRNLYGCSLISAYKVKQLRFKNYKKLSDLENYIYPWHCLVCCKGYGKSDFISNIRSYVLNTFTFQENEDKIFEFNIPDNLITVKPPEYVYQLFENKSNENNAKFDEDLAGVTLIIEEEEY